MRKSLFSVLIMSISIAASGNQNAKWEMVKDKDNIKVYLRKVSQSNIKEFKAETIINAPISEVKNIILNIKNYPKWVYNYDNTRMLNKVSDEEFTYYTVLKTPWPTTDRDIVILCTVSEEDNVCKISTKSKANDLDENNDYVRMQKFTGFYLLTSIGNKTHVLMQLHADPGGNIPAWVTNMMITDGPYHTLKNLCDLFNPNSGN